MERFFYTTDTPYRWSSGAHINQFDPENGWEPISSLERAKELAQHNATAYIGEATVTASYGVIYDLEES